MKKIVIKNYKDGSSQNMGSFAVKSIVEDNDTDKCCAHFVEVDPGKTAYSYHYHEANEEIFYIIQGEGLVKTEQGDLHVKTGDAIGFPANINGSHVISNPSKTEKLVYLDFGTAIRPDIVHATGTQTGLLVSESGLFSFTQQPFKV